MECVGQKDKYSDNTPIHFTTIITTRTFTMNKESLLIRNLNSIGFYAPVPTFLYGRHQTSYQWITFLTIPHHLGIVELYLQSGSKDFVFTP